jgi:hypothetical protein
MRPVAPVPASGNHPWPAATCRKLSSRSAPSARPSGERVGARGFDFNGLTPARSSRVEAREKHFLRASVQNVRPAFWRHSPRHNSSSTSRPPGEKSGRAATHNPDALRVHSRDETDFSAKAWRGQAAIKGARTALSACLFPDASNSRTRLSALLENLRRVRQSWEIAKDAKNAGGGNGSRLENTKAVHQLNQLNSGLCDSCGRRRFVAGNLDDRLPPDKIPRPARFP